jgi:hypothetical protein
MVLVLIVLACRSLCEQSASGPVSIQSAHKIDAQSQLETAGGVSWLQLAPVLRLHGRDSESVAGLESRVRAGLAFGRTVSPVSNGLSRLSISWENRIDCVSRGKLHRTILLGLHAGRLSERGLAEDHYRVVGV